METNDARTALDHAFDTCALFDRSDLGRLVGAAPDLLDLIHRLSTGNVKELVPGTGNSTVVTTAKGRIVDLLFVHRLNERDVLLVGGARCAERVRTHLERYTFAEQTGLRDVTAESYQFALVGPAATPTLAACGVQTPGPYAATHLSIAGKSAYVLGQDGFTTEGFSIYGAAADAAVVRSALAAAVEQAGGSLAGSEILESYRILRGLPAADHELTDEHNPLEAGLREAVSFSKGCYVGQEVVARLQTYDKVSRSMVGLELPVNVSIPEIGTPLLHEDRTVGVLTSVALPPGWEHLVALGYVKRKELRPDLMLRVGENGPTASVVELPFPRSRS